MRPWAVVANTTFAVKVREATVRTRVCNFPMKFRDREIAREIKFPDRESREIGKVLFTSFEILFLPIKSFFPHSGLHDNQLLL